MSSSGLHATQGSNEPSDDTYLNPGVLINGDPDPSEAASSLSLEARKRESSSGYSHSATRPLPPTHNDNNPWTSFGSSFPGARLTFEIPWIDLLNL